MWPFKVIGAILLALAVLIAVGIGLNRATAERGGRDLITLWPLAAVFIFLGLGLLTHNRWAAIVFILLSGGASASLIVGSLMFVPFPWLILNILYGFCLILPILSFFRNWGKLGR